MLLCLELRFQWLAMRLSSFCAFYFTLLSFTQYQSAFPPHPPSEICRLRQRRTPAVRQRRPGRLPNRGRWSGLCHKEFACARHVGEGPGHHSAGLRDAGLLEDTGEAEPQDGWSAAGGTPYRLSLWKRRCSSQCYLPSYVLLPNAFFPKSCRLSPDINAV